MHPVYLLLWFCFSFLTFLFRVIHYVYLCTDEKLCPVWQPHKLFTCFALENPSLKQKIRNVFILMKFSSLTALEVVKNAVSAENFIKAIDKMTLHFQTLDFCVNSVWILGKMHPVIQNDVKLTVTSNSNNNYWSGMTWMRQAAKEFH